MRTLKKGFDTNSLQLLVDDVEISSTAKLTGGVLESGIVIKFGKYNLEDVLCQIIDDYGVERLIDIIKSLD